MWINGNNFPLSLEIWNWEIQDRRTSLDWSSSTVNSINICRKALLCSVIRHCIYLPWRSSSWGASGYDHHHQVRVKTLLLCQSLQFPNGIMCQWKGTLSSQVWSPVALLFRTKSSSRSRTQPGQDSAAGVAEVPAQVVRELWTGKLFLGELNYGNAILS
jgi:hypothetical protein